ncbi:MAG: HD domain-containing protein [Lachnospiraceae bacterium]|nr:HD domain-containing protein [Lachnospiraceae bacterium]
MYKTIICIDDIIKEFKKNHKIANKKIVRIAYEFALSMHDGQKRKTGEPYIMHCLRAARFIAAWGFDSDVICAALLHDCIEDCNTSLEEITEEFGSAIAQIVDAVTSLDQELKNTAGLTKEEIDHMSDIKLKEKMTEKALFVKAADRLDNLHTIDGFPEEKKIKKALHTREIIIPMLLKEEAFQIIDELEDLCLKIEHSDRYDAINSICNTMRDENAYTTDNILKLFSNVFQTGSMYVPSEYRTYLDYVAYFHHNPRSSISVYRQITEEAENINSDFPLLLNKNHMAMYDLTLVINDDKSSLHGPDRPCYLTPNDIFFKLYENVFMEHGICIMDYKYTTYGDSSYFVLKDAMDNFYRLFIKTETQYMRYKLGHVIDADNFNFEEANKGLENKIKVFTSKGEAKYIDTGATMLDFAFMIHSELGFHFDYALVDNNDTHRKAYDKLTPGDTITIVPNSKINPDIKWFKYVKTEKAIDLLIHKLG